MTCYYPLRGWVSKKPNPSGKYSITFNRSEAQLDAETSVSCGQCIGCRLERSRIWALRCKHEASLHPHNSFITLTYDDDNLPSDGSLVKKDFTQFMKNLRKRLVPKNPYSPRTPKGLKATDPKAFPNQELFDEWQFKNGIRFYMCGEYGLDQILADQGIEKIGRPHYHAILFNFNPINQAEQIYSREEFMHDIPDIKKSDNKYGKFRKVEKTALGSPQWESSEIHFAWGKGRTRVSHFNMDAAAYVARYITKKQTSGVTPEQELEFVEHYSKYEPETGTVVMVEPEYNNGSRNPGIAKNWFKAYKNDLRKGFLYVNGHKTLIPKYYESLMEQDMDLSADLSNVKELRRIHLAQREEYCDEQLRTSEKIKLKQIRNLKRD